MAEAGDPWLQRQPTREDVRACYLFILGRPPEDEAVLDRYVAQVRTIAALRQRFFRSDEFRAGDPLSGVAPPAAQQRPPLAVESDAPPALLARMLERTGQFWSRIGETEPWWSVLTQDRFRAANIAEHRKAFYQSGATEAALLRAIIERAGLSPAALPLCVEFGCGAGRVTVHLARLFARVIGCDLSAPHLALAGRVAEARELDIGWHRSTIEAPMPAGLRWDVWYSRLVLQHNPPPVIAHLLRLAFAGLAPGGLAVFQVPTYRVGYAFDTAAYLAAQGEPKMEMHVLPQRAVFALAREAGLEVLELLDDSHALANPALGASGIFVFRRPPG